MGKCRSRDHAEGFLITRHSPLSVHLAFDLPLTGPPVLMQITLTTHGSPPSTLGGSTPSGPHFSKMPLARQAIGIRAGTVHSPRGGSPGAANVIYFSPPPIKTSDLHWEMDNLSYAGWTTIATTPCIARYDNYTLIGCGAVGCEACDRPRSEPGLFYPSMHPRLF